MSPSSRNGLFWARATFALTLGACALVWFLWLRPTPGGHDPQQPCEHEHGRPLKDGEVTCAKYQEDHLDRAKVSPDQRKDVARGMDTSYWWAGGNHSFWRDISRQTAVLPIKADLLALLHSTPRARRFPLLGSINDPDCVAAEKPDRYGLMIDRMKAGTGKEHNVNEHGRHPGLYLDEAGG